MPSTSRDPSPKLRRRTKLGVGAFPLLVPMEDTNNTSPLRYYLQVSDPVPDREPFVGYLPSIVTPTQHCRRSGERVLVGRFIHFFTLDIVCRVPDRQGRERRYTSSERGHTDWQSKNETHHFPDLV